MNDRASSGLDEEGHEIYKDLWTALAERRGTTRSLAKLAGFRAMYGDTEVLAKEPHILRDVALALAEVTNASQGFHDLRERIRNGVDPSKEL